MSAPQSVADSVLGLTQAELLLFRHQQQIQIAAQRSHASGTAQDRGRGTSRQSQPSSRAASAASSQGVPGRIMLDPHSLQDLCNHMDNVMHNIQGRIERVRSSSHSSDHPLTNFPFLFYFSSRMPPANLSTVPAIARLLPPRKQMPRFGE